MSAACPHRLLTRSTPILLLSRRSAVLVPRTAAPCLLRHRLFSKCPPRLSQQQQQHQDKDPYERLREARPLVPDPVASKFTQAGSSRNSRLMVVATVLAAVGFYLFNSQTVPITGRRRFNFLSDTVVARVYSKAARETIEQVRAQGGHFLSDWDPRTRLVKRVMSRLIPVSGMADLNWEIFVIADSSMYIA